MPSNLDSTAPSSTAELDARQAELEAERAESQAAAHVAAAQREARALGQRLEALLGRVQQRASGGRRDAPFLQLAGRLRNVRVPGFDARPAAAELLAIRVAAARARLDKAVALASDATSHRATLVELERALNGEEAAFAALPIEAPPPAMQVPSPAAPAAPPAVSARPHTEGPPPPAPRRGPPPAPNAAAAASPSPADRRAQPRVRLEAVVGYESEDNFYTGFSADISEGGLFISTVKTLPVGERTTLCFSLPNGFRAEVEGTVRWVREWTPLSPDIMPGMGVQFVDLNDATKQALLAFVAARDPLFYAA